MQVTSLGSTVVEVSVRFASTCARKADGTLWCWGPNVGDGREISKIAPRPVQLASLGDTVAHVSAGQGHTCALKADRTVWCWGLNADGQLGDDAVSPKTTPAQVTFLGNTVMDVTVGGHHTCALKTDGGVWCWGRHAFGQSGDGGSNATPVLVCK